MWTGPAPMRPYNRWCTRAAGARFMEYGNGIVGDMCIHMFDMVRWMLDLGWPKRISSTGGILVAQGQQGQHLRHADGHLRLRRPAGGLAAPHLGHAPDPKYPWGATFYGDKGTLKASVMSYDFTPDGQAARPPSTATSPTSWSSIPRTRPKSDLEQHVRAGHPPPHEGLPGRHRHARPAGRRHRAGLHLERRAAFWPTCR